VMAALTQPDRPPVQSVVNGDEKMQARLAWLHAIIRDHQARGGGHRS